MKYFIAKNGQQLGPMEPYEAAQLEITPDTLVWTEGMQDWEPAGQIPEFRAFLHQQPQQPQQPQYQQNAMGYQPYNQQGAYQANQHPQGGGMPPCPSTHLVMAILVTLFCCIPFGIVSIIYASKVEGNYNAGNYMLAQQNSDKAQKWAIAGLISSAVIWVIYIIFYGTLIAAL